MHDCHVRLWGHLLVMHHCHLRRGLSLVHHCHVWRGLSLVDDCHVRRGLRLVDDCHPRREGYVGVKADSAMECLIEGVDARVAHWRGRHPWHAQ